METNIFLPKKINVGYQERDDTYTGKLAYVIYFDEKEKLRKEASWNSWRDDKLGNDIYENIPTSGFVLNKKVGDYDSGWNHRKAHIRIFDPRGFEFEITPENLLYILENVTSTKGKGLEGEFIYGWSGADLVLVPVDSPDYKELTKINELRHAQEFIKVKDLKIGAAYLSKNNEEFIYIGKFNEYDRYYGNKKVKPAFYFYKRSGENGYFETFTSISQKFIAVVSNECVEDYADIFDKLEHTTMFSPVDPKAYEYVSYTLEEFIQKANERTWGIYCYNYNEVPIEINRVYNGTGYRVQSRERVEKKPVNTWGYYNSWDRYEYPIFMQNATLEAIFENQRPMWRKVYLTNGKLYREEK